jgi:hypothetical protein
MEGSYGTGGTGGTSAVVQFMADGLSVLRAATTHIANTIYKSYISGREEKKRKEREWMALTNNCTSRLSSSCPHTSALLLSSHH